MDVWGRAYQVGEEQCKGPGVVGPFEMSEEQQDDERGLECIRGGHKVCGKQGLRSEGAPHLALSETVSALEGLE